MRALPLAAALLLTACGGSGAPSDADDVERAITAAGAATKDAAEVVSANCDRDPLEARLAGSLVRLFECRVETRRTSPRFLLCVARTAQGSPTCADVGSARAVGAGAKRRDVGWKCEDVDDAGRDVGPVFVFPAGSDTGVEVPGSVTSREARRFARELRARFSADC